MQERRSKPIFDFFIEHLRHELTKPLPGREAQYAMAPRPRGFSGNGSYDHPQSDARHGGVLILFYPHDDDIFLPLILRPTYEGVHSGQIGLPGGGFEPEDSDLAATALREAHEEVGVLPAQVKVIGQLSPLYVFASNYLVQPVIGWTATRPQFKLDPQEVAALIETPIGALLDPNNHAEELWTLRNRRAIVPYYRVDGHNVWGATAMILSELLALSSFRCMSDF